MTRANERQVAGEHYKSGYQHWDWVNDLDLDYLPAQVTKYLTRWKKKNGIQDLEKAAHFLEKYIETREHKRNAVEGLTDVFLRDNNVGNVESLVINALKDCAYQRTDQLKTVAHLLHLMITKLKAEEKPA